MQEALDVVQLALLIGAFVSYSVIIRLFLAALWKYDEWLARVQGDGTR